MNRRNYETFNSAGVRFFGGGDGVRMTMVVSGRLSKISI